MKLKFLMSVLMVILISAPPAMACQCPESESEKSKLEKATIVFVGEPVQTIFEQDTFWQSLAFWRKTPKAFRNYTTTFKVDQVLKGSKSNDINLTHYGNSGICGVEFEKNVKYTILAHSNEEKILWTSACDYTEASIEEIEDLLSSED